MGKKYDKVKYNNQYNKETYDRITLLVKKGRKAEIKAVAEKHGESINSFVNRAIEDAIKCQPGDNLEYVPDGDRL